MPPYENYFECYTIHCMIITPGIIKHKPEMGIGEYGLHTDRIGRDISSKLSRLNCQTVKFYIVYS